MSLMNLRGKVSNQLGEPQGLVTVELYEAATWEARGLPTATTITNARGNWAFDNRDATRTWTVVAVSGTKRVVIDAQASIQLTEATLITRLSTNTISERTAAAGVTVGGVLLRDNFIAETAVPAAIARVAAVDSRIAAHAGLADVHHAIDAMVIIAQTAEPAVPAGSFRVWHNTTAGAVRRWLVLGTDGTVAGNRKVEIS